MKIIENLIEQLADAIVEQHFQGLLDEVRRATYLAKEAQKNSSVAVDIANESNNRSAELGRLAGDMKRNHTHLLRSILSSVAELRKKVEKKKRKEK